MSSSWQKFDDRIAEAHLVAKTGEMMNNPVPEGLEDIVGKFAYVLLISGNAAHRPVRVQQCRHSWGRISISSTYTAEIFAFVNRNERAIDEGTKYNEQHLYQYCL